MAPNEDCLQVSFVVNNVQIASTIALALEMEKQGSQLLCGLQGPAKEL